MGQTGHRRSAGLDPLTMLLAALPYLALAAAVLIIPRYIYRPSAEGNEYHLVVLISVGINTILAVGLNLLMGYAGQVSLGHAAFYGLGAYFSAILTKQGVPQEVVVPAAVVIALMAATAVAVGLLRAEGIRLGAAVAGFVVPSALVLHFGAAHWLPYVAAVACCVAAGTLFRFSLPKMAVAYLVGTLFGVGTFVLFSHANQLIQSGTYMSPWYAMLAGAVFCCLTAYLVGAQALRLQGYYLAMATLGFGIIVSIVFLQWEPVTGGTSGIYGIPSLRMAGKELGNDRAMYYLVWALVIAVVWFSANIINSRVGRAFRAVHGSEVAASTLGVDTGRYKVQALVLSAALASIAGSLWAHYVTFISPEPFGFKFSVELVVMVVVGGMASVWGAMLGAGTITVLGEVLRGVGDNAGRLTWLRIPADRMTDLDVIVFGLILMLIMIYMPSGIARGLLDAAKLVTKPLRRKQEGK